ncbi:MAG TPA: hypothetical protein VHM64_09810, partial [Candidatus Binatia bacterium]|nr:hypothetical protein [Candidatus Binatia bacterium]
ISANTHKAATLKSPVSALYEAYSSDSGSNTLDRDAKLVHPDPRFSKEVKKTVKSEAYKVSKPSRTSW